MSWIFRSADQRSELQRQLTHAARQLEACADEMQRLRRAFDALPIGVILAAADGTKVLRNPAADSLTGHARVLVSESADRHLRQAATGQASGQRVEFYGPPRQVVNVRAIPLPGGGALATIEDVSERARLDAVRTDFVANISHELKTPVGALALLAETVAEHDDPEVMRRLAAKMVEEAHRAAGTIDDLLELSRIELGGDAVSEPVDTAMVVKDAVERATLAAERRHITVVVDTAEAPVVIGDH
ncbi:MAG TPA: histidine kinase dimerization/phospho-acceptor domain-containing protein, partial [Ilumatobacteraceae bacterium]|nr:histidine kinase dimerization/phospho-acceptor domain-containing protein [Ilumatobacteraceae bacterium]